jgi:hypothetical protein
MNPCYCEICKHIIIINNKKQIYNDIIINDTVNNDNVNNDNDNNRVEPNNQCVLKNCLTCWRPFYICNEHYNIKNDVENCKDCHNPNCRISNPIAYNINENDEEYEKVDYCSKCLKKSSYYLDNECEIENCHKHLQEKNYIKQKCENENCNKKFKFCKNHLNEEIYINRDKEYSEFNMCDDCYLGKKLMF